MAVSTGKTSQLWLRIFAGPNGSGKSTIIQAVRSIQKNGMSIDFGYYINADDIATDLKAGTYSFSLFRLSVTRKALLHFANGSGLLTDDFSAQHFSSVFSFRKGILVLKDRRHAERVAQIVARYLREAMLLSRKRFSFETVFSHPSNLDIMRHAVQAGYKVYLYFVATESPAVNRYRVAYRVTQGGHNVPLDKIEDRYYRSLALMKRAAQLAYQGFFFDNSYAEMPYTLAAHFKLMGGKKKWDPIAKKDVAAWFRKYYGSKD